ncbi:haloacid dehalogenase superfamily, subfamily IA, variant 3 with third motif having DD or ED [Klebsiella quasipneumoniae]|uniref:HAD family hydrolase n=1 Tax=Klebsiella quasipneumoniae TaxID=1463165 RepID=UPI00087737E0|nr:HAD-IA family hydrolase [Klebsiella quasipneumoniae]SCW30558.1 haloacid dehalogenase superfamily, subfamily IA, variant 3 with third motif having DD or ED [Klebsiella quasipneumoniae]SCY52269.1 haloacid dehalogenase superfamily, subfamily IA, variant 3 with third motif having DD or ED [Klebsiella quasipneumoniae]SCZ49860.1 haloacid dehalogenase superfamily, subfamily IA, variant 3 with third motif having DD or ED [Klebsiella quasipneumoniae]SDB43790.1 haloacid dehalogenase superfamily, subfa
MSIQAVIFDMDGVIIDSESLWRQAQIEALAQWGATASVKECETLTKGKRLDEIAGTWCRYFQLNVAPSLLKDAILQRITGLIAAEGEPMRGVHEALRYFRHAGYNIALATSSSRQVIAAVLNKLSLWHYFDVICSADEEAQGKPHPAVYLTTLDKLNLDASRCLVIEDSFSGFCAAQAAGIPTVVIAEDSQHARFQAAVGRYRALPELLEVLTAEPEAAV